MSIAESLAGLVETLAPQARDHRDRSRTRSLPMSKSLWASALDREQT